MFNLQMPNTDLMYYSNCSLFSTDWRVKHWLNCKKLGIANMVRYDIKA